MIWSKAHSQNAVAAKARRRGSADLAELPNEIVERCYAPRKARARFTLQIRDHVVGDSLTLRLYRSPWPNHYHSAAGQFSAAHIAKAIRLILTRAP